MSDKSQSCKLQAQYSLHISEQGKR